MARKKVDTGSYSDFDLQTENFDGLFELFAKQMSPEQRNRIPDNLKRKLISQINGKITPNKLSFAEKLFIMQRAFDRKWHLVIESQVGEEALSLEHYSQFREQRVWNEVAASEANLLVRDGVAVLGDRDLVRWLFHLNDVSISGAYNHCLKIRNIKPQNLFKERKSLMYFIRMLLVYEGNKRRIVRDYGVSMAEFFCLLYFYEGGQKQVVPIYEEILDGAIAINKGTILRGLKRLYEKKYTERHGNGKFIAYSITSMGINIVNDILVKYVTPA